MAFCKKPIENNCCYILSFYRVSQSSPSPSYHDIQTMIEEAVAQLKSHFLVCHFIA